ncbi:unnamed protein product [Vitrella brassicaformis CCMP3155]|uniref:Endonuclease/exonuclease/phosphatase domain-containing protein n=2 Tax=Vitrella brassicaformis TaxID=1169539 RepID=A0A0G4G1Z3_VITBC|nr:unnamed protein product [Vitrella brassicaformis CCMP3155]|eukprot:CEM21985.1 unnamed protein product [Vitrella brassicaformis CCMP3155]
MLTTLVVVDLACVEAGWATTFSLIKQHYGSLTDFLAKHSVDIFCIQEAKATVEKLKTEPKSYAANEEGYDTFWACCKGNAKRGLMGYSGCATFAKKGLTLRADSEPFADAELNAEGRVLVTEHQHFIIINIYAPTSGKAYDRLPHKLRFFNALRDHMNHLRRTTGKPIILLGDLNIAFGPRDVTPKDRIIDLTTLSESREAARRPPT